MSSLLRNLSETVQYSGHSYGLSWNNAQRCFTALISNFFVFLGSSSTIVLYNRYASWHLFHSNIFNCIVQYIPRNMHTVFVVLCFVVVMQSFIMNSHEVFIHIHQGCFAGTGEIVRLPQYQWSKPDGYGIINQCMTTTKHSKAKTVCIFLGIYCRVCSL